MGAAPENFGKNFADAVKDHLPVRERHVEPAFHRGEIIAALWRFKRRARQFAVKDFDAVFALHHFQKNLEIIGSHLVPEAAATAVEHDDDLVRDRDPELRREILVAHVFRPRDLHFEIVIARAKRADLVITSINRAVADFGRVCAGDAAALLCDFEVFVPAVIVFNAPPRALFDDFAKLVTRDFQKTVTADACRHALEKKIDDFFQTRLHVVEREVGDD